MRYDFNSMLSNGEMARRLGVDPKTLRKWAKEGLVPSYVNPANGYRYYDEKSVIRALKLQKLDFVTTIDEES